MLKSALRRYFQKYADMHQSHDDEARDFIEIAYRAVFRREADEGGLSAYRTFLEQGGSPTQVLETFTKSPEYNRKRLVDGASQTGRFTLPLDLPRMNVDTDATDEQLARGLAKIKAAWNHLGLVKPHFSVLTDSKFLPENLKGGNEAEFWASGEKEAETVLRLLERHGFGCSREKVCVEFGCGVGRVSVGLAKRFKTVHGYDISSGHLVCASERAEYLRLGNLVLHECSETFLEDLEECDFFYSRIVFQHNPPIIITELIKKALRSLRSGGVAVFQVPTYCTSYCFDTIEWLNAEHVIDMQMHCLPQKRIFELIVEQSCIPLEIREDNSTGAPDRFISNTFVVRKK